MNWDLNWLAIIFLSILPLSIVGMTITLIVDKTKERNKQ